MPSSPLSVDSFREENMTTVGAELGSFSEDGLRVAVVGTGSAARAHVAAMGYLNLPPPVWAVGHSLEESTSLCF